MKMIAVGDWFTPPSKPVCIVSLGILAAVLALASLVTLFGVTLPQPPRLALTIIRILAAVFAIGYATYCARQLYENVITKAIEPTFRPALVFISIFWVMVPPVWFFTEYFLLDSWQADQNEIALAKTYADYASKIWAGVVTVLAGLITLSPRNPPAEPNREPSSE